MKIKLPLIYKALFLGGLTLSTLSCKDIFDIEPNDVLEARQVYQNLSDADAAVYGVYGKFVELADEYVILNELRADLVDATFKSSVDLKEINNHEVSPGNVYASPRKFYELISYCNDVLKNLDKMAAEGKINQLNRDERYSDIGSIRSWLYLQLGIHYGNVPYVTEPIQRIEDLKNPALFPRLSFDQLLDELIKFTDALPLHDQYQLGVSVTTLPNSSGGSVPVTAGGFSVERMFIYRKMILGDLYLWANRYEKAAIQYREIMNDAPRDAGVSPVGNRGTWTVSYSGYNGGAWRDMFSDPFNANGNSTSSAGYNWEWIWTIPFNSVYEPSPFINLVSYNNGQYQIKPSQLIINKWDRALRTDGTPGDVRGLNASYSIQNGMPVIRKFLARYDISKPLEKSGIWYLYRAAGLHLHIAEAANRSDKHRLAYSFIGYPLKDLFDPLQPGQFFADAYPGVNFGNLWDYRALKRDMRNIQKTPWPYPWNYDSGERQFPGQYRGQFANHYGIRTRVGLPVLRIDSAKFFDMSQAPSWRYTTPEVQLKERPILYPEELMADMEDKLLDEAATELAFEGHRWPDLVRIARRRKDPSVLAKRIADKFRAAGDNVAADRIQDKLMNEENWYLPFNIQ